MGIWQDKSNSSHGSPALRDDLQETSVKGTTEASAHDDVVYKAGKSIWIADTLSCAPLPDTNDLDLTSLDVFRLVLEHEPHNPRLKDITELMLRDVTASDPVLPKLCYMVIQGWPGSKDMVPKELVPYWNFRDELSIIGGVLYKQHHCVVP